LRITRIVRYFVPRTLATQRLYNSNSFESQNKTQYNTIFGFALISCFLGISQQFNYLDAKQEVEEIEEEETEEEDVVVPGLFIPELPTFSLDEVKEHNTQSKRIWVVFRRGVYDITTFIEDHPGGTQRIMMAAGGSIEPFWRMYTLHQKNDIYQILEELRIGNLNEEDALKLSSQKKNDADDMWAKEPERTPIFKINSQRPFNAEPPPVLLADYYLTPNDLFFVRNHFPVPEIDPNTYKLEITGVGIEKPIELTLEDLKTKFEKHTIEVTIQCAGNRRSEMNKIQQVKGLDWGAAAISNASWSGVKLRDVLQFAGYDHKRSGALHVQFEGLDKDMVQAYAASIPIRKALDELGDTILAYEMNGADIPRDHGYPVRAIVPGTVGARNVKWLGKIILSMDESLSHWQQNDYKSFNPSTTWDNIDFKSAPAIQELPVQSAICDPPTNSVIDGHQFTVRGYAVGGGGRKIIRVDVSIDGGKTWQTAKLKDNGQSLDQAWAWTPWEFHVEIPESLKGKTLEICCKAVDSSYNTQPDTFAPIWNLRGVLSNAWHRISVKIK